ncbi:hypothetical protein TraAM80_03184 [Trypanosoma rangeli]|uniref:Uncharacterized protein n=1 Tax=Trypanosoma rangeli TaxID=5698 RepID=A0A3R7NU48_TRYRA|nr:uncharacterized protein TraAM80_03184 [Trypanosoma rangeli]RNF07737.1 hypothetical protein TraAM80_03184 [Trypanosoma rangeli]|eukprot:RNF07737.1 hypothetical protein TraAM80_03184 [Trypanosoma rangeli]
MQKVLGGAAVAAVSGGGSGAIRHSTNSDVAATFGVFQNVHVNPFPVRAAIDIGTGGMISMTVGRVDAAHNAVRDFIYQTQLPLHLVSANTDSALGASVHASYSFGTPPASFVLSETTRTDIRNKMRMLHGALRRDQYDGVSERTAVISWPLCHATDVMSLAEELTREFKVDVRVLGNTFQVDTLSYNTEPALGAERATNPLRKAAKDRAIQVKQSNGGDDSLQLLMQQIVLRREKRRGRRCSTADEDSRHLNAAAVSAVPPKRQLEQLAFLAHAAVSKCVAPQRMLVLAEDRHRGLCILGADTGETDEMDEDSTNALVLHTAAESSGVLLHSLPVDIPTAQRLLLTAVQHRAEGPAGSEERRSPNPVLREELRHLRHLLEEMIRPTLPAWVHHKSRAGGLICGSGFNGSVLNLAARVAQRTNVTREHLDTHAEMHYCGLTDVLLAVNYPDPTTVLPSAAIASALMRALDTNRFEYLPEVSIAAALLVQPSLWMYDRREKVRATLQKKKFFSGCVGQRTFRRPHARENPAAPPESSWQLNQSWNPLSYGNSTRGT